MNLSTTRPSSGRKTISVADVSKSDNKRITIEVSTDIHQSLKLYSVKNNIKIKDFLREIVTNAVEQLK